MSALIDEKLEEIAAACLGEAFRRIRTLDETLFSSISNSRVIVDFRNLLAHHYGAVDDDAVFGLIYSDLIDLTTAKLGWSH
jgi:uncharacterized protein YutE (UPF0331/DUF86 family)